MEHDLFGNPAQAQLRKPGSDHAKKEGDDVINAE